MRKKLKMRSGSKAAKFAGGGSVRTRARSQGLRQRAPIYGPDSEAVAPEAMSYDLRPAVVAGADAGGVGGNLPVPPEFVAPPAARRRAPARRQMTADDLNEREMTRILNERSLASAQAGRNMYAKGGLVKPKRSKKGAC